MIIEKKEQNVNYLICFSNIFQMNYLNFFLLKLLFMIKMNQLVQQVLTPRSSFVLGPKRFFVEKVC